MQYSTINFQSPDYPDQLRQIASPPKQLYSVGDLPQGHYVAIVGTRRPTDYGRQVTYQLSSQLAGAGFVIVSGLAIGIDAVAHQAAIEAGGKTVAVLGNGIGQIYPTSNRWLGEKIIETGGAIISEYPPGVQPFKQNFPARNRIKAGLCLAVIVTEADARSGSLITANFALEQGKAVMAVPGNITSLRSAGPNNLIKTGAMPVTDFTDVINALDVGKLEMQKPVKADSAEEAQILELLAAGVNSSDLLIQTSGLEAARFANIISLMEITGKVRNLGAGQWISR